MAVITISREPYSGGRTLGALIAERLGYTLFTKRDFSRIFKEYGMISFESFYESPLNIWERMDELGMEYMDFLVQVIKGIASLGNAVIIGRGSFAVLPGYKDTVNIRLWAPKEARLRRLGEMENLNDPKQMLHRLEHLDKMRRSFVAHCFHLHKADIHNAFDIVLNTNKIGNGEAVELIAGIVENLDESELTEGALIRDIPVDRVLSQTIRKVLDQRGL